MSDNSISGRVQDLDLVEQLLSRMGTPDEVAAARRILGLEREANLLALAHSPRLPPPEPVGQNIDDLAVAIAAAERYRSWVDSFPDDDATPLRVRERTLRLADLSVERLSRGAK